MTLLPRTLTQPMTQALARWFAKRAPKSDSAKLNLRNVYIFFSREGVLFAVLLIITFVAGINYGNNLVLGLCFYLVSVWLISFHITFAHISGLQIDLIEVTTAEVGSPVWVTLQVRSESEQPRRQLTFVFEQFNDEKKKANKRTDRNINKSYISAKVSVPVSRLHGTQVIRLPIMTNKRGQLELPRLRVSTVYPLGIMRAWSYVYFARAAWVYPKPLAFDKQAQYITASLDELPTGGEYSQHIQGQDDFERLDSYIEGESLARVSWAHMARGQGMLTKHFADPVGVEQVLDYADMPASHHEQKLAQLAYGAITLGRMGVPFQMQLPNAGQTAAIGQGESFAQACLLQLAKVP
ncbi:MULTISPECIES: DUF58 domain-containing protein [unclassified Psychrobacter]|uniref:DUF58 domain-containing protein n=1 Tax=unclassified Psychrobacter TaxID=196806 RepID=UPI00071E77AA|nr:MULTISPECIES: DUF58 domain-containing protein [unclassified Psychrobacter]OLF39089.1 hypothetical protein BTV98_01340 [Psychrobacter sp. Cmf 22.2]